MNVKLSFGIAISFLAASSSATSLIVVSSAGEIRELVLSGFIASDTVFRGTVPSGGRIIAAADFDANGTADLILQYDPDGPGNRPMGTFLWRFDGPSRISVTQLGGVPSSYTEPVGIMDVDKDGNYEYLMYNPANHAVKAFEVLRSSPYAGGERTVIAGGLGLSFQRVVAVGDTNGDGNDDLLLQDSSTLNLKWRHLAGVSTLSLGNPMVTNPVPGMPVGVGHLGHPRTERPSVIFNSPDGVAPREVWTVTGDNVIDYGEIRFDEAYRSWPIVAVAP